MPVISNVMRMQVPLIGWIGRLDFQKGPDIMLEAVPGLAARACQV
jgi:starch synthase